MPIAELAALLLVALPLSAASGGDRPFRVEKLADGVHLFTPTGTVPERTNSLVVERQDGLLVVEAQPSPAAARELLSAIGELSSQPVRYLVLSHPHAEAVGGASAFPESTLLIGSMGCHEALQDPEYDFDAEVRARAPDPDHWEAPARRLPVLILRGSTLLDDPQTPVELQPVRHSHTSGDLVVAFPNNDILYMGPLLFPDGNPYAEGGHIGGWLGVLNQVSATKPADRLVPLRGPVVDILTLRRNRDGLAWLRGHVQEGFVDRVKPEAIPARVLDNPGVADYFNPEASPFFLSGVLRQVVEEAIYERRKRGLN